MRTLKESTSVVQSLAPATRTTSANGTGVDVRNADDILFVLTNGTTSGTTPTLDVTVEDSADNSSFAAVSGYAFTQVTAAIAGGSAALTLQVPKRAVRRYVRAVATIAGTTPSFACAVLVQLKLREV